MKLPGRRATSVNGREWIVVDSTSERVPRPRLARIVLPPDAGPEVGPPPVLACPDHAATDDCDGERLAPREVGETDWVAGERQRQDAGGAWIVQAAAFGPDGENVLLTDPGTGEIATQVHVGPGPLFTGNVLVGERGKERIVAAVWPAPGSTYDVLETPGFPDGILLGGSDASGWIVGNANAPIPVPVVLVPDADRHVVERLPLLPGASAGVASGVDDHRVVGWSNDDAGRSRAVVWTAHEDGFTVESLPLPPHAEIRDHAAAISGARIAGACRAANGAPLPTVWTIDAETGVWRVEALLEPLVETDDVVVNDISGDLVVGLSWDTLGHAPTAVAWRLP